MIMKPVALHCVIGGFCKFKTIKLEFAQAFQLLELHMKYLHSPKAIDERDDIPNHDEDLEVEEDNFEIEQLFEETVAKPSDTEGVPNIDPVVEEIQSKFADVTSVRNDQSTKSNLRRANHEASV